MNRRFTKEAKQTNKNCKTITNTPQTTGIFSHIVLRRNFFSHCSQTRSLRPKVPAGLRSGEGFPLGLRLIIISLLAHTTFPQCLPVQRGIRRERERERDDKRECLSVFSYKDSNLTLTAFHFYDFI